MTANPAEMMERIVDESANAWGIDRVGYTKDNMITILYQSAEWHKVVLVETAKGNSIIIFWDGDWLGAKIYRMS